MSSCMKKIFQTNSLWFGAIIGFVVPVIFYYVFTWLNQIISNAFFNKNVFTVSTLQVIAVFMNVIVFRIYTIRMEKDFTGRGILLATFVYAFIYLYKYLD